MNGEKISALDFTNTILASGFEHHYPVAKGDYCDEVAELNAWLGIGAIEKIRYKDHLQEAKR